MLLGLTVYLLGTLLAHVVPNFHWLWVARILCAFGAAVGSVVTQTMLRDSYRGEQLAHVFSIMGGALAISPIIGLMLGGFLANWGGYLGVFSGLSTLSIALLIWALYRLPETQTGACSKVSLLKLSFEMLTDPWIWRSVLLIAAINVALFSYYGLAPFIFNRLGFDAVVFGYSGAVLAVGALAGALINRRCLKQGIRPEKLVDGSLLVMLICSIWIVLTQDSLQFLLPMLFVSAAFGVIAPNVLSQALNHYQQSLGSAGALLGLFYYLLMGAGLLFSGWLQNLGLVLVCSSVVGCGVSFLIRGSRIREIGIELSENRAG
ncbi:MFS transporter [Dongshaea marina]|uniref:MFS transporter n=1 Tax=Dongshaea marina TaxID=2047966 RepID=UPI001F382BEC|nr:MFS transporter [Dongshaea marina]